MYFDEDVTKKIIDKILLSPKNLATPSEVQQQCKAALCALERSDKDRNFVIDHSEIKVLCSILGLPIEDEDETLLEMDKDQTGQLESIEFLEWWLHRISQQSNSNKQQEVMAKNTFKRYDADNSDEISCNEFAQLVRDLGADFSDQECHDAIKELDRNDNGFLEINEFVAWWTERTKNVRRGGGLIAFKLKKLAKRAAQMFHSDIHQAVWNNDLELVKMFVESDTRCKDACDTSDNGNGWTPLQYACYRGYTDIVQYLLQNNASVNRQNDDGFTALFYAVQQEQYKITELLLNSGADCSISGWDKVNNGDLFYVCPIDILSKLQLDFNGDDDDVDGNVNENGKDDDDAFDDDIDIDNESETNRKDKKKNHNNEEKNKKGSGRRGLKAWLELFEYDEKYVVPKAPKITSIKQGTLSKTVTTSAGEVNVTNHAVNVEILENISHSNGNNSKNELSALPIRQWVITISGDSVPRRRTGNSKIDDQDDEDENLGRVIAGVEERITVMHSEEIMETNTITGVVEKKLSIGMKNLIANGGVVQVAIAAVNSKGTGAMSSPMRIS